MSTSPVGAACPFCHFTVKTGAATHACPSCGAVHHEECWTENGGCAVTGCAGAPATGPGVAGAYAPAAGSDEPTDPYGQPPAEPPTAIAPRQPRPVAAASGPGWPSSPPPAAPSGGDGRGRWIAIGAIVPTVLVIAGVGGYLIAGGGGDDKGSDTGARVATGDGGRRDATTSDGATTRASTATGATTTTTPSQRTTTTDAGGGSSPGGGRTPRQVAADQMVRAMDLSARGRTLSAGGDLGGALANRERVLAQLAAITPGSAQQEQALEAFRRGIVASRDAIRERRVNPTAGANTYDIQATSAKREFCRRWSSAGLQQLTARSCDPDAI